VINAGDGIGEHPTQALLDVYSAYRAKRDLSGLKIALAGDLLNGRTVHSTIPLLSIYGVELYLIAPPNLRLPEEYKRMITQHGSKFSELESWDDVIAQADILYMTRIQKERFASPAEYDKYKNS